MIRSIAFTPLLIAAVLGGFFVWGLNPERDPGEIPSVLISAPAPDFTLPPIEGVESPGLARSDLGNGDDAVIVNVFASWCVPCRAEHSVLTRIAQEEAVTLYGINYKDKPKDAAKWLDELGNPYAKIGSDFDGRVGIEWGISGVPETFIITKDGIVAHRTLGPVVGELAVRVFKEALTAVRQGN